MKQRKLLTRAESDEALRVVAAKWKARADNRRSQFITLPTPGKNEMETKNAEMAQRSSTFTTRKP